MVRASRASVFGLAVASVLALPGVGVAKAGVGERTLGDPLLPQLGNGGYDVSHYRIKLDYDPATNVFDAPKTTTRITATADQKLREFSLDFQDLDVASVAVGEHPAHGRRAASFEQVEATPDLSSNPDVTQPMKLVVTPHPSTRPEAGRPFTVVVRYSGGPEEITDPDESIEGWIRACYPLDPPRTCDGAFVVNEPMGAQSWFPSNNYPTDKATFDTLVRVPSGKTAFGVGELASRRNHPDGTTTWRWTEDDPTATYLTTATVGDFDYTEQSMLETSTARTLPVYNAIDSSATAAQKTAIQASLAQAPGQLNFLSDILGPYPFDSTGAVADRASGVGYALEVQTKPHYAGGFSSGNPAINIGTQLHELAHQWIGNSVTLAAWNDIWFNEGWATWFEWHWDHEVNAGPDPSELWDESYADEDFDWTVAPAVLDNDPANLFHFDPVYQRGAMTIQGYREIVGDETFFAFLSDLTSDFAYSNISTPQFIELAKEASGFTGDQLNLLDQYFQQWLYGEAKPTIVPEDFQGP